MSQKLKVSNFENLIGFGKYQFFHYLIDCLLACTIDVLFMAFGGAFPKLSCLQSQIDGSQNITDPELTNKEVCSNHENGLCDDILMKPQFESAAYEWNLICDKAGLIYRATTIQMFGVMIGAPLFGQLSDIFGRKKLLLSTTFFMITVGGLSALAPNIIAFTAFRFFIGLFTGGVITTGYVFLIEFIKEKRRLLLMAVGGWPLAYMAFGLLGYLTKTWRNLALYGNLLGVPVFFAFFFTLESPKWLIQRGKIDEARQVFLKLAKWNNRTIDINELDHMMEEEREKVLKRRTKRPTFAHLFYSWKFVRYTASLAVAWFSVSCVSYGLLFNMEKLSGSIYLNMVFYGMIRIVISLGTACAELFIPKCGRKHFHITAGGFIAVCSAIVFILFATGVSKSEPLSIRVLCLLAACMTSTLWLVVYLMAAEVYPTPIRNLANSFCSVMARIGGMLAPQVLFLGHKWEPGPFLIFAIILFIDILVFQVLLPETKGKPLPDHMPGKEERIIKSKKAMGEEAETLDHFDDNLKHSVPDLT